MITNLKAMDNQSWEALIQLLNECAIDTGVSNLAQQHDHYLYGLTKNVTNVLTEDEAPASK